MSRLSLLFALLLVLPLVLSEVIPVTPGFSIDLDPITHRYSVQRDATTSTWLTQDLHLHLKLKVLDLAEPLQRNDLLSTYFGHIKARFPRVSERLMAKEKASLKDGGLFLVQFKTQVFPELKELLTAKFGARVLAHFPSQAVLVFLRDPLIAPRIQEHALVNWIGEYHPLFKIGQDVAGLLAAEQISQTPIRFNVMMVERGPRFQRKVASFITEELGGDMVLSVPEGFRIEALLTLPQLLQLLARPEVLYVDLGATPDVDMDIARLAGGLEYLNTVADYSGQGVRAEVMDSGLHVSHTDFKGLNIVIHGANGSSTSHGSSVFGIVFGQGVSDPKALGGLPNAEASVFAAYELIGGTYTRYLHTSQLVDPSGPYRTVFQTNSWGNTQTTEYTTLSAEFDDILFMYDITILQSQSNTGSRNSRPEAWAKNILSVGGFYHYNTLTRTDDIWGSGASTGPAEDGRQKPDVSNYYDQILTTSASNNGYTQFSGTSGATPITAGHVGIVFQMWADGVFAGSVGQGRDVFNTRPHASTAKALVINTASQHSFSQTSTQLTRYQQGWGTIDVGTLYDVAKIHGWVLPLLVDESDPIAPLEEVTYTVSVSAGDTLKVTLVYRDPMPLVSASKQLINNLDLRVTSPSGVVYWGNNALTQGTCSAPGGGPSSVDNVENVFICGTEAGTYRVSVLGTEVIEDTYPENGVLDAIYSLVASKGKK